MSQEGRKCRTAEVDMSAELNTVKMSSKGQITISSSARKQLGLGPESQLVEVVINNCLLLIPQNQALADIAKKAKDGLLKLGLTPEELRAGVEERQRELIKERYPGLSDD
ncbi:MAG TPA: AbrB/MazE/SpoVT family DNA-binding domain-containing protein [Candidatus Obscuribacterales bacterium]